MYAHTVLYTYERIAFPSLFWSLVYRQQALWSAAVLLSAPCVVGGRMPPNAAAVAAVALLGSLLTSSGFVGAPSMTPRGQVS